MNTFMMVFGYLVFFGSIAVALAIVAYGAIAELANGGDYEDQEHRCEAAQPPKADMAHLEN